MTQISSAALQQTPYQMIGGRDAVATLVDRFYDLMETEPQYIELRRMHEADLGPMRRSLTGFLTGWLGGPGDWWAEHPGVCIMSAHARLAITEATARQWTDAMARALEACEIDPDLRPQINAAFLRMSAGMVGG